MEPTVALVLVVILVLAIVTELIYVVTIRRSIETTTEADPPHVWRDER